jgi:GTP-binding protein
MAGAGVTEVLRPVVVPRGFPGRVEFIKAAQKLSQAPHLPVPEVCVCGRSNVGKSSLLNVLANRKGLARVSGTPGRTREIHFYDVQGQLLLVDLPGYGWAKVPRPMRASWGESIRRYLEARPQLRLAILLVDMRHDPTEHDRELLDWFRAGGRRVVLVATKADQVPLSRRHGRIARLAAALDHDPRQIVAFSATERFGREELWGLILAEIARAPP